MIALARAREAKGAIDEMADAIAELRHAGMTGLRCLD